MNEIDFLSIHVAHRNPIVRDIFECAIRGEFSKSSFVDKLCDAPHFGRNKKKAKGAKQSVYFADLIERELGVLWAE